MVTVVDAVIAVAAVGAADDEVLLCTVWAPWRWKPPPSIRMVGFKVGFNPGGLLRYTDVDENVRIFCEELF